MLCYDFTGRVAVVTGGRQGIGAAMAGGVACGRRLCCRLGSDRG